MKSTIKLESLVLSNFRSFSGNHEIKFPENGLIMLVGDNKNTSESSGSGKSSLVEAIAYAFDYSSFASTDLCSWPWMAEGPMSVSIGVKSNGSSIFYQRSKKPYVKIGDRTVTSAKSIKEELEKNLGASPEILKSLTYRPQGKPGMFLDLTDQEKKEFLTKILGLEIYEAQVESTSDLISGLETDIDGMKVALDVLLSKIPSTPEKIPDLDILEEQKELDLLRYHLTISTEKSKSLESVIKLINQNISKELSEIKSKHSKEIKDIEAEINNINASAINIEKPDPPLEPEIIGVISGQILNINNSIDSILSINNENIKKLKYEVNELDSKIGSIESVAGSLPELVLKKDRIDKELKSLRGEVCPTCSRSWVGENSINLINSKESELSACTSKIDEINAKVSNLQSIRANRAEIKSRIENLENDVKIKNLINFKSELKSKLDSEKQEFLKLKYSYESELKNKIQKEENKKSLSVLEAKSRLDKLQISYSNEVSNIKSTYENGPYRINIDELNKLNLYIAETNGNIKQIENNISYKRKEHENKLSNYERLVLEYEKAIKEVEGVKGNLRLLTDKLNAEKDYLGFFKAFLSSIFDEILGRIAQLTNERLAKIPNVQDITIEFVSERETKTSKTIRQEIVPVIYKNGNKVPLKSGVSGGQYSSIELAIDLSLADTISERTGVFPGWLILDEAFNGLPVKSKQSCLEMLKEAAKDRLIIVVDHATEIKEFFDYTIKIINEDGFSKIETD